MSDRRSWFKRIFKLDYDEKFDGALELIQLQEYELDRTATLAERTDARVDGLQEAVKVTVKRVDDIESKIDAIRDFDFGGRRMLAQFDIESALAGDTAIRVQLDNVNHEARLRYGSVDVVDTIDAVWFISKTGVPIDNDFGDVLHPNAQRRDVIEFLKITSDLQGNVPLPGDGSADIADLDARLNQEIIDRTDGDANLQSQIDNIQHTPPYDDTDIKADLAQEVTDRTDADAVLDGKITKEASDRAAGDTALDTKINKEVTDRKDGDTALDAKITKEVSDRTTADKALDNKIDAHLNNHPSGGNFMPITGGEFQGPILGPVIDPVGTDALSISVLNPWDDSIPAVGELVVSSALPDSANLMLKFNLGKNINYLATRTDLYYILVTANGQQIWTCENGGTALNATTLKVVPDKVEGEILSPSGDVFLFVTGSDGYPYATTVTVDRMVQAYLSQLPGVDSDELDKKLNKAGDDLTGDLVLKPTSSRRWIGFKNFPPKNADGSNDTQDAFGTRIDIDTLNTWKSRFKVTSRYGDIFTVSGGGGPALHVGPVNTKSDDTDPDNELKRVPLFLSPGEPENDDEAASKQYVDELGERLTADADLDWWGYGDYTFKRASDSAGSGFL